MTDVNVSTNKWRWWWKLTVEISTVVIAVSIVSAIALTLWVRRSTLTEVEVAQAKLSGEIVQARESLARTETNLTERIQDLELTVYGTLEPKIREQAKGRPIRIPSDAWILNSMSELRRRVHGLEQARLEQMRR